MLHEFFQALLTKYMMVNKNMKKQVTHFLAKRDLPERKLQQKGRFIPPHGFECIFRYIYVPGII